MSLPRPVGASSNDPQPREPIIRQATANGAGVATITLEPISPGFVWLVDYFVIGSTSTSATACNIYDGIPDATSLLDGTASLGNSAVASYVPARVIPGSRQVVAVWTNASAGAVCTLRVEYRTQNQSGD